MFKLIVGEESGKIENADVPVRWCVDTETVAKMDEAGFVDPHVLIVSTPVGTRYEMDRQLVPLSQLMTFVRFTKAKKCAIHAWIVNGKNGRKSLEKHFMKRSGGSYDTSLIFSDGSRYETDDVGSCYASTTEEVTIPDDVFGKEMSPWMKKFVNLWHDNKPVDECSNRRRTLLAFTLKWIPFGAVFMLRYSIALLWASLGFRKQVKWNKIHHMFEYTFSMLFGYFGWDEYEFTHKRYRDKPSGNQVHIAAMPFTPIVPIVILGVGFFVGGLWEAMVFYVGVIGVFIALDIIILLLLQLYDTIYNIRESNGRVYNTWHGFNTYMIDNKLWPVALGAGAIILAAGLIWLIATFWWISKILLVALITGGLLAWGMIWVYNKFLEPEVEYTEVRELLCPADDLNKIANVQLVLKDRWSLSLWWKGLKNKVCRPMQY